MKCQIKGCGVERADLSQHIRLDHNMSIVEYKQQYNVKYVVDESKREKRGATRKKTNQKIKLFKCEICDEACQTQKALHKHYSKSKDSKHSQIIFNELNCDDWVECIICGLRRSRLDLHLKADHNMTTEQYTKLYKTPFLSKNFIFRTSQGGKNSVNRERFLGSKNPFYGKHHSDESRESIGETTRKNNCKKFVHHNFGRKHTSEAKQKMSDSRKGEKNPMFGRQPDVKTAHSIHGYRKDIGHSVRSTLEANYARFLIYNKIKYEHEPKSFVIETKEGKENCWIDFYLVETKEWVEIKNYTGRDISKIELVKQQYPKEKIKILYADSNEWKTIEEKYSKLILLWETSQRNLRTHPELYLENIELNIIVNRKNILPISKDEIMRLSVNDRERLSDILFRHFREYGFPYTTFFEKELIEDFTLVVKSNAKVADREIDCNNNCGYKIRENFIREQYVNFKELFKNDNILKKVIRNRLGLDKRVSEFFEFNNRLLVRGFEVLYPNFRFGKYNILLAKWIVETFCAGSKVYDYSCGWGSRLIGTLAAGKSYVGVDTNSALVKELQILGEWLENFNCGTVEIINEDASRYIPRDIDFAYSCPPYGVKEKYRQMPIKTDNEWFEFYFKPVVKNCFEGMRAGGCFVCHISLKLRDVVKFELDKRFKFFDEFYVKTRYSPFVHKKDRQRINDIILIYRK
jgi:hypothetical protein